MSVLGRLLPSKSAFNKNAVDESAWSYQPKFSDGLNHPFIHYLWEQMIHHKKFNEGGLKHRFFSKAYNLFYTPGMQEQNLVTLRSETLRNQAVYFINHLPLGEEHLLSDQGALINFIENHCGYSDKQFNGINAEEIAMQISKEDEALAQSLEHRTQLTTDVSKTDKEQDESTYEAHPLNYVAHRNGLAMSEVEIQELDAKRDAIREKYIQKLRDRPERSDGDFSRSLDL